MIHNNKLAHRYLTDIPFKVQVSLYLSLGINIFYAGLKLFYSVYYCSVWFATLGVYYFMLAVMRFLLLPKQLVLMGLLSCVWRGSGFGTEAVSDVRCDLDDDEYCAVQRCGSCGLG